MTTPYTDIFHDKHPYNNSTLPLYPCCRETARKAMRSATTTSVNNTTHRGMGRRNAFQSAALLRARSVGGGDEGVVFRPMAYR